MKNIELKLSVDNFGKITSNLKKMGVKYIGKLYQTDIYYNCRAGRLKLREINNKKFAMIFYKRPDTNNSKTSDYQIFNINKEQAEVMKSILTGALGEKAIVKKTRDLWIYKNTRIHLDKVDKLGKFLELETIDKGNIKKTQMEHKEIINLLNLSKYKKIAKSYGDMF